MNQTLVLCAAIVSGTVISLNLAWCRFLNRRYARYEVQEITSDVIDRIKYGA